MNEATEIKQAPDVAGRNERVVSRFPLELRAADALARECAKVIAAKVLDTRSGVADALLDYLNIGGPNGPRTVDEWCAEYDKRYTC